MKKFIVFLTVFALALGLVSCAAQKAEWQSHLDLGQKYLLDGNYEQAIVEFNRVIEIDPKNVEAYIGLADAYAALGDYESAIEALERGIAETDSDELRAKLEEIRALAEAAASAGGEGQGETEAGGDEDRGGPETTGQEEQTEQEEETPEVMPIVEPDFSIIAFGGFVQRAPSDNPNVKRYNQFSIYSTSRQWLGMNETEYDDSGKAVAHTAYMSSDNNFNPLTDPGEHNVNVTKTENKYEDPQPYDEAANASLLEYDPEREVWVLNFTDDSGYIKEMYSEYNKDGYIVKSFQSVANGSETVTYKYDSQNKLTNASVSTYISGIDQEEIYTYDFDSNGRIIKIFDNRGPTWTRYIYYEYDSVGNLVRIEEKFYDQYMDMELPHYLYIIEYDSDNLPIRESAYNKSPIMINNEINEDWELISVLNFVY